MNMQVVSQKVDINMKDGDGATPLHFAASRGHVNVVRWLLTRRAKICLDKFGRSPLNDAAENEQLEVHQFDSLRSSIYLIDPFRLSISAALKCKLTPALIRVSATP